MRGSAAPKETSAIAEGSWVSLAQPEGGKTHCTLESGGAWSCCVCERRGGAWLSAWVLRLIFLDLCSNSGKDDPYTGFMT